MIQLSSFLYSNGIGRSGAFICMHSQMERMKAEAMVNIFQFIKAVRIQRAGLVTTEVCVMLQNLIRFGKE